MRLLWLFLQPITLHRSTCGSCTCAHSFTVLLFFRDEFQLRIRQIFQALHKKGPQLFLPFFQAVFPERHTNS